MNKSFSVFYSQAFSFPQTSSCQSLHFLIFRALIPPHLSFLLPLPIALLPSPLTPTAFSLWRLTSLANPCTDKRAKCVLLTINITWDALKIKAAPLLSPCTLRPPSSFLFISIQIAGRSTVCRDVPTLIGMRWGRINTHTHKLFNAQLQNSCEGEQSELKHKGLKKTDCCFPHYTRAHFRLSLLLRRPEYTQQYRLINSKVSTVIILPGLIVKYMKYLNHFEFNLTL